MRETMRRCMLLCVNATRSCACTPVPLQALCPRAYSASGQGRTRPRAATSTTPACAEMSPRHPRPDRLDEYQRLGHAKGCATLGHAQDRRQLTWSACSLLRKKYMARVLDATVLVWDSKSSWRSRSISAMMPGTLETMLVAEQGISYTERR